jgi:hypothetical protein
MFLMLYPEPGDGTGGQTRNRGTDGMFPAFHTSKEFPQRFE